MYFKRPSFRRGGGINELTPRVYANSGYFGQTPLYNSSYNYPYVANAAISGGQILKPNQMMKSFPADAAAMGVSSQPLVKSSSAPSKVKTGIDEVINTTDEFIFVERQIPRSNRKTMVKIRNPNYQPKGELVKLLFFLLQC